MILQIIQQILGIILFLLSGILLSYIVFSKTDIIKRVVYSIVLAVSVLTILGVFLYLLNLLTSTNTILSLIFLILLFLLILKSKDRQYKTHFNRDIWYLLFFSLIGTAFRFWFVKSIKNFGDAYNYAFEFVGKTVPNLGFYTGMATDHSRYIGSGVVSSISNILGLSNQLLSIFLITFVFLGFVYLIFSTFRNKKLAYLGVALMALGPIEIFHNTLSIGIGSLSYISLFSLFLLFKTEDKNIFWIALLLAIVMMFTYYTASMIMFLTSTGFIFALFIKDLIRTRKLTETFKNSLTNKKIRAFLLIAIIVASYTYIFSNMMVYTFARIEDFSDVKKSSFTITEPITKASIIETITKVSTNNYKGPTFFGLSAVGWQEVFFFLCGLTFIFHIVRKRNFSENNIDLLLCLIPISIVSYGFFHVNLPTRIFNYFAFFGLLVINIPKKYFKIFFILSFIFILITSFYFAKDKRIFFETSDKEIEGALWISNSLQGKVFSDQRFIGRLILEGYYNVTGATDDDPLVYNLFYQNDSSIFLDAINILNVDLSVDYIVLTEKMQKQYILMLDFPQKPLINTELYEENLIKVYDNGDVKVYKIN